MNAAPRICTCGPAWAIGGDLELGCPVHDEYAIENARRETFFATDHPEPLPDGSYSNLSSGVAIAALDAPRLAAAFRRDLDSGPLSLQPSRSIVPPWLLPSRHMTRDSLVSLVTERLFARGYRPHLVFGEREPHHVVVHALAFIPQNVLGAVREEIHDYIPMAVLVDVSATDCGHEDCHTYPELGQACYESTHPRAP